jgi:pimeloyl-ACP methyl ester carboxylesterase
VLLLVIQSDDHARAHASLVPGANTPWFEMVRSHAPHAQVEVVPGVGHFTMLEAPDAVNRLLAAFVAKAAPGR